MTELDPTTFTLLSHRLDGVARNMQHTLVRSSRSGVIANGHDCSCCVLTAEHELLSVAETIPIHVMSGADRMAASVAAFHPEQRRGDAYLHNSPYHGCTHAADLSVLVPVFDDDGVHRFTVLAKSHQADIGNSKPTTYMADAKDVYEEGALIFPAVQLQQDYQTIEDVVRLGRLRIRAPEQWYGDLLALIGAARTGERMLEAVARDFGWNALGEFAASWLDYAERRMIEAVRAMPDASYTGESVHDAFPGSPAEGIRVRACVTVDTSNAVIQVDLRDNIDCLPNGLNLSEATARSAALIGVFNCLPGAVPVNAGSSRRVEILLREGCVVGVPHSTASCSVATTNVADRVVNAVHQAMSGLGDPIGHAEAGAIEGPAGAVLSGVDPRFDNAPFINQLALAGTAGAGNSAGDGWLSLGNACSAGMWTLDSIEVDELTLPLRVLERRLLPDTEGAGEFRGAPACRVVYESTTPLTVHYAADGVGNPARGVNGGGTGAGVKQWLCRRDGQLQALPGLGELVLQPGEKIIADTSAGGGYGLAENRDPTLVARDVADAIVTVERAYEIYHVVLDERGQVDVEATSELRAQAGPGANQS